MMIIIDAYNFIKQALGKTLVSEREMVDWIHTFREYTRLRNNDVQLVFDAGPFTHRSQDIYGRLTVIYSGHKLSADEVIQELLLHYKGSDVLLVTSDREVRDFAKKLDVISVGSQDFYKIFHRTLQREAVYEQKVMHTLYKTSSVESEELDRLMEQSSRYLSDVSMPREEKEQIRIRNDKKVAKQDKKIVKKLEKI